MEHPVKVAACKILFGQNGGTFTELGNPRWERDIRALCDKAWDCGQCPYMGAWLQVMASKGYSSGWECDRCLKKTQRSDAAKGIERVLPAYYQAGRRFDLQPEDADYDPDRPGLDGCTHVFEEDDPEVDKRAGERCGWESSFLQLILRR